MDTVAGAGRFQGIRPQSVYVKDQPSWPISVSNWIYETYDLGNYFGINELRSGEEFPFGSRSSCSAAIVQPSVQLEAAEPQP